MYNDEHNLYHYTYRKDGSEAEAHSAPQPGPVQDHNSGPQQPVQEMKPVKKNRIGLKVTALALCCALLGGAVGGGIVSMSPGPTATTSSVSRYKRHPPAPALFSPRMAILSPTTMWWRMPRP